LDMLARNGDRKMNSADEPPESLLLKDGNWVLENCSLCVFFMAGFVN
jgi:hypothetical protein